MKIVPEGMKIMKISKQNELYIFGIIYGRNVQPFGLLGPHI